MLFTEKCLSCANADQMCCTICGVGRNGEREKYKQKPRTNADHIRSMTDEELAKFLCKVSRTYCGARYNKEVCFPDCWLAWLKEEVKE